MKLIIKLLEILFVAIVLGHLVRSHQLCIDTSGPKAAPQLDYCTDYKSSSCCSSDDKIKQRFSNVNPNLATTNPKCAGMLKSVMCASCDPYAAHLFGVESEDVQSTPILCTDWCTEFYDACSGVLMSTSNPFGGKAGTLKDTYPTSDAFCKAYGGDFGGYCFSGEPYKVVVPDSDFDYKSQICTQAISTHQYLGLGAPADGTDRIFAIKKSGVIDIYNKNTNTYIGTFLDISGRVYTNSESGLLSIAFHPNYASNGKFYLFYSCNPSTCSLACQTVADCGGYGHSTNGFCSLKKNPGQRVSHINIVAEYHVSASDPNKASTEERVLIKNYHPFANHNGGWMAFNTLDKYLYISFGDGGLANNFEENAQDMSNFMGKVIRIDVTSQDAGLNYHIPDDNPFVGNQGKKEIWALGFRNPWRCSFDKSNPTYLFCGDVGQDQVEEVDLVRKGGNYGWSRYEASQSFTANENLWGGQLTFPIMEYNHGVGKAIIGGYVYRGTKDACQCGKYIFADYQYGVYFQGIEKPVNSGKYTRQIMRAERSNSASKITCPTVGQAMAFGEDHDGDLYFLTLKGMFKVTSPSQCGINCPCDCLINGQCLQEGDTDPLNSCRVCKKEKPCSWTTIEGNCIAQTGTEGSTTGVQSANATATESTTGSTTGVIESIVVVPEATTGSMTTGTPVESTMTMSTTEATLSTTGVVIGQPNTGVSGNDTASTTATNPQPEIQVSSASNGKAALLVISFISLLML